MYRCHYEISGYRSNELSSNNSLYECKLCIRSRTSDVSLCYVNSVEYETILMLICENYIKVTVYD
jgi:hypothetical protein